MFKINGPVKSESLKDNLKRHPAVYIWFILALTAVVSVGAIAFTYTYESFNAPVKYVGASTTTPEVVFYPGTLDSPQASITVETERIRFCPAEYRTFWTNAKGTPISTFPPKPGGFTPIGKSSPSFDVPVPRREGKFFLQTHVISYCPEKTYITSIPPVAVSVIEGEPVTKHR